MKNMVSVIIPVYNVAQYIERCVNSVCLQTYSNLEIILVDDGSTDGSSIICDILSKKDDRIYVIHKTNGGLSSARNEGLKHSKGEYIYFLDGDDYIEADLLEKTVHYMNCGFDLVCFNYKQVTEFGQLIKNINLDTRKFELSTNEEKLNFFIQVLLKGKIGWEAWNRVFRHDILNKFAISFVDNSRIFAEDLYFNACYCAHISSAICINKPLYNYVQRQGSIMDVDRKKNNIGRFSLLAECVLEHYKQYSDCNILYNNFSAIFFSILLPELQRMYQVYDLKTIKSIVQHEISNFHFFCEYTRKIMRVRNYLNKLYTPSYLYEQIAILKYLTGGSYKALCVKNRFIYRCRNLLDITSSTIKKINKELKKFSKNEKCIYILGTEEYGNIGDHAIAEAICYFISKNCPDSVYIEITVNKYFEYRPYLKKYIKNNDIIVLTGGGNLGDVYQHTENVRRDIILTWRNIKKVVFPQSIYFNNHDNIKKSKDVYNFNNNVILSARERNSFLFARQYYTCKTILVPDIVLYLNKQEKSIKRDKRILFCMRNDVEKLVSQQTEKKLYHFCVDSQYEVMKIDTQLDYSINYRDRKKEINRIISLFQTSSLVVTDRLHGMIFSAISGTPCIVLENYNHKIKGTYDLIKYLNYIRILEDINEFDTIFYQLIEMKSCRYYNENLLIFYGELAKKLLY